MSCSWPTPTIPDEWPCVDLGAHLLKHGARVRIVQPPGDDGADIADKIEQGGATQASAWLKALAADFKPEEHEDAPKGEAGSDDDWQSNLLSRAKTEPGALFEDDTIKKLVALRNGNRSAWINLRSQIRRERKIDVPIRELDKAIARTSADYAGGAGLQGRALKWPTVEPSHEPVHGPELLCTISAMIRHYVDMPDAPADATALWIIHTWLHPRLEISTFLNVASATKRCGKSLLMEVAGALVFRPLLVSGRITPPALFRIIESAAPTLMLDEADTYFGENHELRGIVNGSQRLGSAWVIRCEGDDHEPRAFNTWCPKAISGIGGLPDTVLDRSLVIRLERRAEHGPQLSRWRDRDKGDLADLCGRIARWVQDNADAVLAARKGVAFPPPILTIDSATPGKRCSPSPTQQAASGPGRAAGLGARSGPSTPTPATKPARVRCCLQICRWCSRTRATRTPCRPRSFLKLCMA